MENNFYDENEYDEEFEKSIMETLESNGLYSTFQMLNGAKNIKKYWKRYLEDRKKEERELVLEKDEEDDMANALIQAMEKAFNVVHTKKMDEDAEETMENMSKKMSNIINTTYNNEDFIKGVSVKLDKLKYDSSDNKSRCEFLATMIVMQRMIPGYYPNSEEQSEKDKAIAKKWLPIKQKMAQRISELSQKDYRILFLSVSDIRSFFSEPAFLLVHSQKIVDMSDEQFASFMIYTQDGMDGNNPIIKLSKKQKKLMCNSEFVNSVYKDYVEYRNLDSLEDFQKLSDIEKFSYLMSLKSIAERKYKKYESYTTEERESGYADIKEKEKEDALITSPEFKEYLRTLSNLTDEQFAYIAFDNLSSSTLMHMYGGESKIFQYRLNSLSIVDLIAIANHYSNASSSILRNVIEKKEEKFEITDTVLQLADSASKVYKDVSRVRIPMAYTGFKVPTNTNFYNIESTNDLLEAFEKADEMATLDESIASEFKRVSELDDIDLVQEINLFNKKYSLQDGEDKKLDIDEYDEPYPIERKIEEARKGVISNYKLRILSLPKKMKGKLIDVPDGILSDAIKLTKSHEIMQAIKDFVSDKKKKESDAASLDD